ncbi:hypothetical protein RSOLAG1IB_09766 [Rhizoctonia solani AG-1 IB]|uniref:Protein kinase domain-containing protein n=1 Tax=Thanatephorus cucumeris (strain AG1-IB / isolate 7/3/14) TaxID=1108050 RepID=A0A0B7FTU7_THACB|nr:hypothetical protein RSOLAG1IB_09766 [Rhizoctonia solani AG-1 IB]
MPTIKSDRLKRNSAPGKRSEVEERWVSFQPYLLAKGYRLRPRYQPDWTPSWANSDIKPRLCEDSLDCLPIRVLDATRIEDERQVKIKMVVQTTKNEGIHEYALLKHFSVPPLKDNPSNHVVPLLDHFPIPGIESGYFVVMPLLSHYTEPAFHNMAEIHDFFEQVFEGLLLMHNHNVAHCDIAPANVMMDARPLYEEPFHPYYQTYSIDAKRRIYPRYRRSQKLIRYYFIDLGYAKWFPDEKSSRKATDIHAREAAPEQVGDGPYDPFAVDIYQLGIMIQNDFIDKFSQLNFLSSLINEMTQHDPNKRPDIGTARSTMNTAFLGLSGSRYRWPLIVKHHGPLGHIRLLFAGLLEEVKYLIMKILNIIPGVNQLKGSY